MNSKERSIMIAVLASTFFFVALDILKDSSDGVVLSHIALEASVAVIVLFGIFYLLKDTFSSKNQLRKTAEEFRAYQDQAEVWKKESRKYIEGLSVAIDAQLEQWGLTKAEKEVAFLLLKGMSSKEIADIRETAEKTVRVQSTAIYAKAGLSNRSELSAFFLEDLLVPQSN